MKDIEARPSGLKEINLRACPYCGKPWHAYFDPKKEVGFCFHCFQTLNPEDVGAPPFQLRSWWRNAVRRDRPDWLLQEVSGQLLENHAKAARSHPGPPGLVTQLDKMPGIVREYALRRVPEWFLPLGRLGWCDYVPPPPAYDPLWRYRLLLLTFENGHLVQWTGRTVLPGSPKPKYYNPPTSENPIAMSSTVFNLDLCAPGSHIYICEGPLSAVSIRGGVAVMGASVSAQQAARIVMAKPSRITLFCEWEAPVTGICRSVSNLLRAGAQEVYLARLGPDDPNDDPEGALEAAECAVAVDLKGLLKLEVACDEWKRNMRKRLGSAGQAGGSANPQTLRTAPSKNTGI